METFLMRGMGTCYRQAGSRFWWIQYWHEGKRFRESSECVKLRDAQNFLRAKLLAFQAGVRPVTEEILMRDLYDALERDYAINRNKSIRNIQCQWQNHLAEHFGNESAMTLTPDRVTDYIALRQKDGAKNATVNRELAALKRMFVLAIRTGKLSSKPYIPQLEERNTRKGFVKDCEYDAMARETGNIGLWLRTLFEIGYSCGFRKSELLDMRVRQVDLVERTLDLDPGETKNDEPRKVEMTRRSYALIKECVENKGPEDFVFTRGGRRIVDFRDGWTAATEAAGCPGLLFHDLRRSAIRNLIRAGVSEKVAMQISGHKTRSVFERYHIVDSSDMSAAVLKLEKAEEERRTQNAQQEMFEPEKKPAAGVQAGKESKIQ
jgi:integrase